MRQEQAASRFAYERWMAREGLPILRGYAIDDPAEQELGSWARLGGRGAYVDLVGMEGATGMYICEIPAGGALEPEKHLFEEVIRVINGRGAAEVWQPGGRKQVVEWAAGTVFAPPMNTWHRLVNGTNQPVRFTAITNAPMIMDFFHNEDFILGCDYAFTDRYRGQDNYFLPGESRHLDQVAGNWWETNFVPDIFTAKADAREFRGTGVRNTQIEPAENCLVAHFAEWPAGYYQRAHFHGGGATLTNLKGEGYTLMWPREVGMHPYSSGKADRVVRVDFREGTVFSPPDGWFHQHFNPGPETVRHLAVRYGSHKHHLKFAKLRSGQGLTTKFQDGGAYIHKDDEDPEIRRMFEKEVARSKA